MKKHNFSHLLKPKELQPLSLDLRLHIFPNLLAIPAEEITKAPSPNQIWKESIDYFLSKDIY